MHKTAEMFCAFLTKFLKNPVIEEKRGFFCKKLLQIFEKWFIIIEKW